MDELKVETLQRSVQSLEDITRCAICLVTVRPNAVQCVNGHMICAECKADLTKCPTCEEAFSDVPLSRVLVEMLEALPRHCRHKHCGKYLDDDDEHEKYCGFRHTICRIISCDWKGSVNDLLNHIKQHKSLSIITEKTHSRIFINVYQNVIYNVFSPTHVYGHFMWQEASTSPELNYFTVTNHWVPIGKPEDKLYVERKFVSPKGEEKEFSCQIKLNSDPEADPLVFNTMYIPKGVLQSVIDENNKVRYEIYITKE